MQLTYKDIKNSVYRLCFLEESEYEDYSEYLEEAVNFALTEIAREFPLIERCRITSDEEESENGYKIYDMMRLTKDEYSDESLFMGFADTDPVIRLSDEGEVEFCDYSILQDRYLVIKKDNVGEFDVFYKKYPKRINENTGNDHRIEFRAEVANLIPLLCAWRIFKDDDETKAALYYNEYLRMKSEITAADTVKKRAVVIGYPYGEGVFA